jgi:hypothetical protein
MADTKEKYSAPGHVENTGAPANGSGAAAMNIIENPLKVRLHPVGSREREHRADQSASLSQKHDKARVIADAEQFCRDRGLEEHSELFARAALVARHSIAFESVGELEPEEREALLYEREHKYKGTFWLWYSVILCAVGAAVQGWDQTGSNAANLSFPKEFGIDSETGSDPWKVGAINSAIYLVGGGVGCCASVPVSCFVMH